MVPKTLSIILALLVSMAASGHALAKEKLRIGIGHQSTCIDTYSGGIIVKELHLLQKYLPRSSAANTASAISPGRRTRWWSIPKSSSA